VAMLQTSDDSIFDSPTLHTSASVHHVDNTFHSIIKILCSLGDKWID